MALVDDIEHFGRAVQDGELSRDAAAQALSEATGGGLTLIGAGMAIDGWKSVRADYQGAFKAAGAGWARSHGLDPLTDNTEK
ncbi:hypothetical protein [Streptomyces sp. NPDC056982]|uniref:hypothetical protein n=1 Tax=Streptomyces sp. NPDC056982 TaxID=3345986 RepID=UPI0036320C53